jgi:hypothetical protein
MTERLPTRSLADDYTNLHVCGWDLDLVERDGELVWEVSRYELLPQDRDKRGHRKRYANEVRVVHFTTPWARSAINWAVAERNTDDDADRARLFWMLENPGLPYPDDERTPR